MSGEPPSLPPTFLASIQPIVLVGGKSTRFGRDKLREPIGNTGELLVQRPIRVLRAVFGPRVKLVGECDPSILPLADGVIPDEHPGAGPMGGILSALKRWGGPVFVLAGDMPGIRSSDVLSLLFAAAARENTWAVVAKTDRVHPCAGLYWPASLPSLSDAITSPDRSLHRAIPAEHVVTHPLPELAVKNVNVFDDLPSSP